MFLQGCHKVKSRLLIGLLSLAALLVSACGGGGGGSVDNNPRVLAPCGGFSIRTDALPIVFLGLEPDMAARHLYGIRADGTELVQLDCNGFADYGGAISNYALSPDRRWVAYTGTQDGDNVISADDVVQLYASSLDGTSHLRLNADLVAGGDVVSSGFSWSADSTRVAYRADQETDGVFQLKIRDINAPAPIVVAAGGTSAGFAWSPDGDWLAYTAGSSVYVSNADATSITLIEPFISGVQLARFMSWSPDGSRVAYAVCGTILGSPCDFYVSTRDGTTRTKVSGSLTGLHSIEWAPDSQTLAILFAEPPTSAYSLAVVRADSEQPTVVVPFAIVSDVQWSPDAARLAAITEGATPTKILIWDADGSNQLDLTPDLVAGGNVIAFSWNIDGSRISYSADQEIDDVFELYSVRPDGTDRLKLYSPPSVDGYVTESGVWSPDGNWLAFRAREDAAATTRLYVSSADAAVNLTLSAGYLQTGFRWTPDSSQLIYRAGPTSPGTSTELTIVDRSGSPPRTLSEGLNFISFGF